MASEQSAYLRTLYQGFSERLAAEPEMGLAPLRDLFEGWHLATLEPEGVSYQEVDAGGVPSLWAIPAGGADDRVVVFTHGGGYVVGSRHTHRKLAGHLAKAAGVRVLVLDYRLAPEHPHPAPVEDAVTAYRWLLQQGYRPEHIATCGDSAGGGLCTSMVVKLRDEGDPLPAAIMPLSPWYDMEMLGETLESRQDKDLLVQREILQSMATTFLGEAGSARDPLANPLYADPTGLPPMLIQVGDHETLLDDAQRFAARAREKGVDVTVEVYPEMQHVFQFLAGRAPEGDQAVKRLAEWVRPKLGL
ncbi:MAG: alpha/beta hydrolase [Candidatus Dormibacteraeota bacterium]|nr:alpha/beta hydrolase [Candidatus Dormibacteraeota bacterium]